MTLSFTDSYQNSLSGQDRFLITQQCADLANIYKDQIDLCLWEPQECPERNSYARFLASQDFTFTKIVSVDNAFQSLYSLPNAEGLKEMKQWIVTLVEIFSTLFGFDEGVFTAI